jgi:O-Antigen ligase
VRRVVTVSGSVVLVAGPTALAFFTGGYFDAPRAVAMTVAWLVVLMLALAGPLPLPRSAAGWAAVVGLAGLAAWSAISLAWAPVVAPVIDNVERLLLYLGALLAAIGLLRDRRVLAVVEPALMAGSLIVIGYGLSERLLPGLIDLEASSLAVGRLEQPITYWNAEGLVAAMGFVLAVRVAGDGGRTAALRAAAAGAAVPLALGTYLSFSRGALAALAVGLLVLLAAAPNRAQLVAIVNGVLTGAVASAVSEALQTVITLEGSESERVRDGLVMLAVLAVLVAIAVLVARRETAAERRGIRPAGTLRYAHRLPAVAAIAGVLCVGGLVAGGLGERSTSSERAAPGAERLASFSSRRYEYWRVGVDAFAGEPLRGIGSGAFRVVWRQERSGNDPTNEVHSLVLEMTTELGIPGLLLLASFIGGIAVAARRALLVARPLAAGAAAACSIWLLHASIDWDWQLPAATLPMLALAGGLIALGERDADVPAESAPRRAKALSRA